MDYAHFLVVIFLWCLGAVAYMAAAGAETRHGLLSLGGMSCTLLIVGAWYGAVMLP